MPSLPPSPAEHSGDSVVKRHRPDAAPAADAAPARVPEIGGRKDGTDPTRYGDWEKNGRCIDF